LVISCDTRCDNYLGTLGHSKVVIPANATATVTLPGAGGKTVICNSKPIEDLFKENISQSDNHLKVELGSGSYQFVYPSPF